MESTLKISKLLKRNFTSRNDTMQDVFDSANFVMREAKITDGKGKIVFQDTVLFPDFWSDTAVNITASRYFYKGDTYFEKSLKHLITRIVTRLSKWLYDKYPKLKEIDEKNYENNRKDLYIHIFEAELTFILLHQFAAFNSPVYFNLGVAEAANKKHPETCSACFILGIDDNMPSIKEFGSTEWDIFVSGSGSGANFSKLRGSMENIKSGGGTSSGPLDFIKGFDSIAGRIRSGGRLRRAAIMRILDIDHPDIENFIQSKVIEEEKAHALIEGGFDSGIDGDAYRSVALQNGNHSVRVTDEFMQAVQNNNDFDLLYRKNINDTQYSEDQGTNIHKTIKAKKLFDQIAEAAWKCGDPGIHFKDNINRWNTIPNSGPIDSSNPCLTLDSHILTSFGFQKLRDLLGREFLVQDKYGDFHKTTRDGVYLTEQNAPVYKVRFSNGLSQRFTGNHEFKMYDGTYKKLLEVEPNNKLDDMYNIGSPKRIPTQISCGKGQEYETGILVGWFFGDGSWTHCDKGRGWIDFAIGINEFDYEEELLELVRKYIDSSATIVPHHQKPDTCHMIRLHKTEAKENAKKIGIPEYKNAFDITKFKPAFKIGFLRGLSTTDGSVRDHGKCIEIYGSNRDKLEDFLRVILEMGGYATLGVHGHARSYTAKDGIIRNNSTCYKIQTRNNIAMKLIRPVSEFKSSQVILSEDTVYTNRYAKIFITSIEEDGFEDVYDITVPETSEFICGGGCTVHNCSEVFNIDNTACNLSSINMSHFVDGHRTNIKSLEHTAALMFLSQDLMIDNAAYPSTKIKNGVKNTRNIGLGITNVGSTLMKLGLPYSSELARLYVSSIMALLTAKTYSFSSYVAEDTEPFPFYKDNVKPIATVLEKHNQYIDNILKSKTTKDPHETDHYTDIRAMLTNAQSTFENLYVSIDKGTAQLANCYTTCIAPAGTISLMMDASTTGIEPEYSLIKYKKIANGDIIQMVNNTIKQSLHNLGYTKEDAKTIIKYILDNGGSVVNAPLLRREHYSIFECADSVDKQLIIKPEDHLRMLTDVQRFVGMSISKTINIPNDATAQDIQKIYMMAWELGAKCISIYRDGSKGSQPMSKSKTPSVIQAGQPRRRSLPDERNSITHKFEIGHTKGYITVGLYEDGSPGELFIVMANVGTFTSGMIDTFARSVSLGLQYGVPIDKLAGKLIGATFQPNGITSNENIQMAKSISDYIGRWLYHKFVLSNDNPVENKSIKSDNIKYTGNVCSICNEPLIRSGACELCVSCGETTGCS